MEYRFIQLLPCGFYLFFISFQQIIESDSKLQELLG